MSLKGGASGCKFFWQRIPKSDLMSLSLTVNILWLFKKYTLVNVTTLVTSL